MMGGRWTAAAGAGRVKDPPIRKRIFRLVAGLLITAVKETVPVSAAVIVRWEGVGAVIAR